MDLSVLLPVDNYFDQIVARVCGLKTSDQFDLVVLSELLEVFEFPFVRESNDQRRNFSRALHVVLPNRQLLMDRL